MLLRVERRGLQRVQHVTNGRQISASEWRVLEKVYHLVPRLFDVPQFGQGVVRSLTLDEFLALPEEEPALELEPDGTVSQKVSPKGQHSTLQLALCEHVNEFARPHHLALAFPELRAVYADAAYVPDVAV
jgi:hypothetical protein